MRWSWLVVGGVATLLFVAGLDALRSSADSETSAPTASTATADILIGSVPPCRQPDLTISIDVLGGIATVVVRNIGAEQCYRLLRGWRLTIQDRLGKLVMDWTAISPLVDGFFPAGSQRIFSLPRDPVLCDSRGGPFVAFATVGPYSARRRNLSSREIACGLGGGPQARRAMATYIARADAICRAASARVRAAEPSPGEHLTELEAEALWSEAAASASGEALAKLRSLAPPEGARAQVNRLFALTEQQTDVLRQLAAAASAGHAARVRTLGELRIRLTHQKDGLVDRLTSLWGVSPDALYGCPVSLPA